MDGRRLLNLQRKLFHLGLLIIDELGFVPRSPTGAELLFEVFSQRYAWGSILNQSQGGMCICQGLIAGLGVSQQLFSP